MQSTKSKKLIVLTISVFVFFLIIWFAFSKLLDPNFYKPQIISKVKQATGRELKIKGDMKWSLFPLGFEINDAEIGNLKGFGSEPFAELKNASIRAQFGPILRKQLVIESISIDGFTVNLVRNSSGQKNWMAAKITAEDNPPAAVKKNKEKRTKAAEVDDQDPSATVSNLHPGEVTIKDATINWKDELTGQVYSVQNLKLETTTIDGVNPFDVDMQFSILSGNDNKASNVQMKSTFTQLQEGFRLSNFNLKVDESTMTGNAELTRRPVPVWKFDFAVDSFDADQYLQAPPKDNKSSEDQTGESPLVIVAGMNGTGKIKISQLKIKGLKFSDLALSATIADGIFHLGPNSAKLYGGVYSGQTMIDASSSVLGLQLNEKFLNVQSGPLFKDMQVMTRFSGTGSIHLNLNLTGSNAEALRRSVTGSVQIGLTNGKIQGVDLEKMIRKAKELQARFKGKPAEISTAPTDETLFKTMTATVQFTNGIGRTQNIRIEGNVLDASGGGTIDLIRETVDLKMKSTVTEPGKTKGTNVPLIVKGPIEDPKFGVDWNQVIESAVERNVESQINKALKKLFKDKN